jgi:prepilin-type N-terminal cleavage/methylation domain-containing protein
MYRNKAGFTLIELLIVVSIIGILTIAAITAYTGVQLKAARSEAFTNLEMIRMLQEQLFADSGCYEGLVGGVCPNPGNTYACLFDDANNCRPEYAAPFPARAKPKIYLSNSGCHRRRSANPGSSPICARSYSTSGRSQYPLLYCHGNRSCWKCS